MQSKVYEYSLASSPVLNAAQLHVSVQIQNLPCCVRISRRC